MAAKESEHPVSSGQRQEIARLLGRIGWLVPVIVATAFVAIVGVMYFFIALPLTSSIAHDRERQTSAEVSAAVTTLVTRSEQTLRTMADWSRAGALNLDDIEGFNRLLGPLLRQHAGVSSVHLASDAGREVMLLEAGDHLRNRVTDVPGRGFRQRWLEWSDARKPLSDEWKEQDYDPRKRPWFAGALRARTGEVHWTEPYIFQTTRDPGITASIRWRDEASGTQYVLALDLLLIDLSRFTRSLQHGKQGYAALLTSDDRLLGVPRQKAFEKDADLREALLKDAGSLGLEPLAAALRRWHAEGSSTPASFELALADGDWLATISGLSIGSQNFRIATLAPKKDFLPWSDTLSMTLLALLAGVLLLALLLAQGIRRGVSRPLTAFFDEAHAGVLQMRRQVATKTALGQLVADLQNARTPVELGRQLLSQLAPRLELAQGLVCGYDAAQNVLRVLATYGNAAGDGADERTFRAGEGLLGQCLLERRPIALHGVNESDFVVRSGLGDASPREILVLPILHGGELLGVIELGTFRVLSNDDRHLLGELMPVVAMNLEILRRSEHTERLLAITAEANERSRLILESVTEGIWGTNADGETSFVNSAALAMLGYSEEEVLGRQMHEAIHHSYADGSPYPRDACLMLRARRDGKSCTVTTEVLWRKDGTAIPVEYVVTPVIKDEVVVGTVVVFRAIDARSASQTASGEDQS